MRDQVRQEANLTLQQENLTTLQDTVAPDEVALPQAGNTFVWPQPSFEQVLCRWYKLSVPTWSYTQSQDTTVLALDISKALFNVQTLFDRIKRYRYWRSGVKVKLQVNSTPFHYGSLMCGIVPHYVASEASFQPVDLRPMAFRDCRVAESFPPTLVNPLSSPVLIKSQMSILT